jgi:hypothetical protein
MRFQVKYCCEQNGSEKHKRAVKPLMTRQKVIKERCALVRGPRFMRFATIIRCRGRSRLAFNHSTYTDLRRPSSTTQLRTRQARPRRAETPHKTRFQVHRPQNKTLKRSALQDP